jgi:oxygen-independent coproporphyrinogen-3 oxidase
MPDQELVFDPELIRKYDRAGPRYTSYPTAPQFRPDFGPDALVTQIEASNRTGGPLSLYFHLPFCEKLCFYCACTKIVTRHREWSAPYVDRLLHEMDLATAHGVGLRPVEQLHWGGGTPTFLPAAEMARLMEGIRRHFEVLGDDRGEYGIEVDPRQLPSDGLGFLRQLGFNRLSLGVQDLDPTVQKAVNRVQDAEATLALVAEAQNLGFRSVSLDLIYGLPFQDEERFARTLERVLEARPNRLSIFNYAHLPERFTPQQRIRSEDLPTPEEKLRMLARSVAMLQDKGYVYIGMDHFALPDDELAVAQREGTLHRNFQGYSTHAGCDLFAFGMSAISMIGPSYSQNFKDLETYSALVEAGRFPVERGVVLTTDDLLRRHVITRLICDFALDYAPIEEVWGIRFEKYFAGAQVQLREMAQDGLLDMDERGVRVLPRGRLLIRNICMAFDAYLGRQAVRYSRVI